ncbi:MAG: LLM class flavin-dependent oxidoreductase, partial [SAR202 cluster bacterium]|nr:LLM class flavin-dependent oxidoreductase [SAR202 cluster bacterium]
MDISLMVEGQNGLTWDKWSNILAKSEEAGLAGVFRSDHFFIGEQLDSLEPYLSFVMASLQTSRIRFGPMVTPVTFRPPANV